MTMRASRAGGAPAFLAFVVAGLLVFQFARTALIRLATGDPADFLQGYSAACRLLESGWSGIYDLEAQIAWQHAFHAQQGHPPPLAGALPFVSPPPAALLFVPVALLPPAVAVPLWMMVNLILALSAVGYVAYSTVTRALPPDATTRSGRPGVPRVLTPTLWLTFAFVPLVWGILVGQAVGFSTLLYSAAFLAFWRRGDGTGAVMLALLAIIKPQLTVGPVVFLVAQRRWRALGILAACGILLGVASLLLVGVEGLMEYQRVLRQMDSFFGDPTLGLFTAAMVNWRSWVARIPGITETSGAVLTLSLTVIGLVTVAVLWRRRVSSNDAFARAYLCFTAAGIVASFHSTYQDLVILLPPATAMGWLWITSTGGERLASLLGPAPAQGLLHPRNGRAYLALAAGMLLFVLPSLAWLVVGPSALYRGVIWATMGLPGLLLLMAATVWRAPEASEP